MHTITKLITISSLAIILTACSNSNNANKDNFKKAIQAYLDTQGNLCAEIKRLPFSLANDDAPSYLKKRADALVDAGLLTTQSTDIKTLFSSRVLPGTEYQVSEVGKKFLVANTDSEQSSESYAFCTGKHTVLEVENFTEPSDANGVKQSYVNYRYKIDGIDDWAKSESIRANFKNFAEQSQENIKTDVTVFILTNNGWMHQSLFERK